MNVVALLPFKANSTRVPGKNFRDFHGRPLFLWMLQKLLNEPLISHVVVNTDAIESIRRYSIENSENLIIRERKPEICGDEVSMNVIIEDDIAAVPADAYFMTHTTNPLLHPQTISNAIAKFSELSELGVDSVFSVNRHQSRFFDENLQPLNHDLTNLVPTQSLPIIYEENSNFYIFTGSSFESTLSRIGRNPSPFITDPLESIDIDTEEDWRIAWSVAGINMKSGLLT